MKSDDLKWTIREMAARSRTSVTSLLFEAGVSRATLHRWNKGLSKPRPSTVVRINQAAERLREKAMG